MYFKIKYVIILLLCSIESGVDMGRLVMIKCDCGFVKSDYRYGCTAGYSESRKHLTALVRCGRYGKAWKERLASDNELLVDATWALYQCRRCRQIYNEYSLDLYKSEQKRYAPDPDDVIYHFKHICPECQARMDRISLCSSECGNPQQSVICPKCGKIAAVSFCGFID